MLLQEEGRECCGAHAHSPACCAGAATHSLNLRGLFSRDSEGNNPLGPDALTQVLLLSLLSVKTHDGTRIYEELSPYRQLAEGGLPCYPLGSEDNVPAALENAGRMA